MGTHFVEVALMEERLVPVVFSEEEWQFLQDRAEESERTIQEEVRKAVQLWMKNRGEVST